MIILFSSRHAHRLLIVCSQLSEDRQALQAVYRELCGQADEQTRSDADSSQYRQVEPEAWRMQYKDGGQQLSQVVEEATGCADTHEAEPAGSFQQAHGSERDECAAHTVEEYGGASAEHGGKQDAYDEDQQDITPGRQAVESYDRDEIGESELGTWNDEGQRNESFKDEKGEGLGNEQAYEDESEGSCRVHIYTS